MPAIDLAVTLRTYRKVKKNQIEGGSYDYLRGHNPPCDPSLIKGLSQ
jgi:hypothetical protein